MKQLRIITVEEVADAVCQLFISANQELPEDCVCALERARQVERDALARQVLDTLEENLVAAREMNIPICQDTGMAVVFVDLGADVHIVGGTLESAINMGVARAYGEGKMRLSIVSDPLFDRCNTGDNTPAIIHIRSVAGDSLTLTAAPKGFGSENMSRLKMFTPAATADDIADFVVDAVKQAGANPCPPITIGVGIGADFEGVALLSKKALMQPVDSKHEDARYQELEERILARVNQLGIGPQGFGGDTTAFAVHILTAPTHIAGLPCAVSISCHANRHLSITI